MVSLNSRLESIKDEEEEGSTGYGPHRRRRSWRGKPPASSRGSPPPKPLFAPRNPAIGVGVTEPKMKEGVGFRADGVGFRAYDAEFLVGDVGFRVSDVAF